MGLKGFFGNSKKKAEQEAEEIKVREENAHADAVEEQKASHSDISIPEIQPLSPIKVQNSEQDKLEDEITKERKDEIIQLVYELDLNLDSIRFLSTQELLFLLTVQEAFNAKVRLQNFDKNHRALYNELLTRIRDANVVYVLYDKATGYPFLEHGFANIYLEKETAEKAAEAFAHQFRSIGVRDCKTEEAEKADNKRGFFDYLYYLGIERIIIDNGLYRAHFRRSEIVAPPDWAGDNEALVANPALAFSMIDFLGEIKWPVKYEKRQQVLQAKEMRMISLARTGRFIVPIQHEGPTEVTGDGKIRFNKDTKLKFPVMKNKDGGMFLPIFTDGIEFSRKFAGSGFEGGIFKYQDILRFIQDKDGIVINPAGENIMLLKNKLMELEAAANASKNATSKKAETATADGVKADKQ